MAFYLSGAGGAAETACGSGDGWKMGGVYGFLKHRIADGKLYATYYYTSNKKDWSTYEAPAFTFNP